MHFGWIQSLSTTRWQSIGHEQNKLILRNDQPKAVKHKRKDYLTLRNILDN